jgi:hypothetical protein
MSTDREKLAEIEQRIIDLTDSEEYKLLANKNCAWASQKPTDQEKGEWELLQEQLTQLQANKKFWQDVILNSTASYARKKGSVR